MSHIVARGGHSVVLLTDVRLAIFHLRQSYIGRSQGMSVVRSAAYRHSTRMMVDERGRTYDYSGKNDTIHSEVAFPDDAPAWIRNLANVEPTAAGIRLSGPEAVQVSERFWNAVEAADQRANGQFARETTLALPQELSAEQNIALVREFVASEITPKGYVADWAFHLPDHAQHNPHVHILTTLRPLTEDGFGRKSVALEKDGELVRKKNGQLVMQPWAGGRAELYGWREAWADHVNVALARAGFEQQVDHRTLKAQGLTDLEPGLHNGPSGHLDKRGVDAETEARNAEIRQENFKRLQADPGLVIKGVSRQLSTFDNRDIARYIRRYAGPGDDVAALIMRVGQHPDLQAVQAEIHDPETNRVVQQSRFTSSEVIEGEAHMIEDARSRAEDRSFRPDDAVKGSALERAERAQGFAYTGEQRAAIDHLLRAEGISVMVGFAGAGKSTVLRAVKETYAAETRAVVGAALAGKAAEGLQASAGIESRTIASWERSWDNGRGHLNQGDIFVLDEAGMVASAQMQRVVRRLDEWGAKIVLVGDGRQLQPIEAGAAFRAIAHEIGYVELNEVRRQHRSWQAEASVAFGRGSADEALAAYHERGHIHVHGSREDARSAIIAAWQHDWSAGADVLMLAHTNKDVLTLNAAAREVIKADGGLSEEAPFVTERGMRHFAEGDRIIFLENDRDLGIKNGTLGTVLQARSGHLSIAVEHLDAPVTIDQSEYANVDHGYALTIHKTQGATIDKAHVLATGTMDAQLSYVAMTRHRDDVTMHIAADSFRGIAPDGPGAMDDYLQRLSREGLKDTTLAFEASEDYRSARASIAERRAAEMPNWLARFIDIRGWAQPDEVRAAMQTFAEKFTRRASAQEIDVPSPTSSYQAPARTVPPLPERFSGIVTRLEHVRLHSDRMGNEGVARREAFHLADHALHGTPRAHQLRQWGMDVGDLASPSQVMAIGRIFDRAKAESLLPELPSASLSSLEANWREVFAVSRAIHDVDLLDAAHAIHSSKRAERLEAELEAQTAPVADEKIVPDNDVARETTGSAIGVDLLRNDPPAPSYLHVALPAVKAWPETAEATASRLTKADPSLHRYEARLAARAGEIWREPDKAWAALKPMIDAGQVKEASQMVRDHPNTFGPLNGSRTVFMRNDAERQKAENLLPAFATSLGELADHEQRLYAKHLNQEKSWRAVNAIPTPALSSDAQKLLNRLLSGNDITYKPDVDLDRRYELSKVLDTPAWDELKSVSANFKRRFPSDDRGPAALPGLSKELATDASRLRVALPQAETNGIDHLDRERYQQRLALDRALGRDTGLSR
nr:Ti-type conjugative transfer relaxase TraA [Fulvimarina manganoxydans]